MTNLQQLQEEELKDLWKKKFVFELGFKDTHSQYYLDTFFDWWLKKMHIESESSYEAGQQDMLEGVKSVIPKENKLPDKLLNPFYPNEGEKYLDMKANQQYKQGFNTCREETLKALDNLN